MPITCTQQLTPLDRAKFGKLSYSINAQVLATRKELGRFFDERIYKQAVSKLRDDVLLEVPVQVTHGTFRKLYDIDLLVAHGSSIEFKAAEALVPRHRAQLLHYLMLVELKHGMLINVRPNFVTHEYVNNLVPAEERRRFDVTHQDWNSHLAGATHFQDVLTELLLDWGTGLDTALYDEGLIHHFGGESEALRPATVSLAEHNLGSQKLRFVTGGTAFKLASMGADDDHQPFLDHAQHMVNHVGIDGLIWANVAHHRVHLRVLRPQVTDRKK